MLGITFSAEAEPSAAERISDCFQYFESRMDVIRLARYRSEEHTSELQSR